MINYILMYKKNDNHWDDAGEIVHQIVLNPDSVHIGCFGITEKMPPFMFGIFYQASITRDR